MTLKTVTLTTGIKNGDNTIKEITLRKPVTGDLRGVKLVDFFDLDIDCLAKVLPRITIPALVAQDIYSLDLVDLAEVTKTISDFLQETSSNAPTEFPAE